MLANGLRTQVLENPEDLDIRRVYADTLIDAGDPFGEFIQLQCLASVNRKQKARQNALLKVHREEWLGPLAPLLKKKGMLFENGFLSHCVLDSAIRRHTKPAKLRQIGAAVGNPLWSTVKHLQGALPWPESPTESIYLHPVMQSLRSLIAVTSSLPELCCGTERPIEVLHTSLPANHTARFTEARADFKNPEAAEAVSQCSALPNLHTLTIDAWVATLRGIGGPVLDRLQHLRLEGAGWRRSTVWDDIAPWPKLFREMELSIPCIELREGGLHTAGQQSPDFRVLFRLDHDQKYSRVEAQVGVPTGTITSKERLDTDIERFATMLSQISNELTELNVVQLKKPKFEVSFAPFEELASAASFESFELPSA